MQKIIFTDLDGTLIDYKTYSFDKAREGLELVRKKRIPLVICSSKTKAEIEVYIKKLGIDSAFISENGGAIYLNGGKIELGKPMKEIIKVYDKVKDKFKILGFNEMSDEELAEDSGLGIEGAKLAKKRGYDEPFKIISGDEGEIMKEVRKYGMNCVKSGKYYHINKGNDKGKAVIKLIEIFKEKYGEILTIGIGDSNNDFEMLDEVEDAYLVQMQDGSYASDKYKKAAGIGPVGWNNVIKEVL